MKKLQQCKPASKNLGPNPSSTPETLRTSPPSSIKPFYNLKDSKVAPRDITKLLSPPTHFQSPKFVYYQTKTPVKAQEKLVKSPNNVQAKQQKTPLNIEAFHTKEINIQVTDLAKSKTKAKLSKSPVPKATVNAKRLSNQHFKGIGSSQDKRLSSKYAKTEQSLKTEEDPEHTIRYSVLDVQETETDEQIFNLALDSKENTQPIMYNDSGIHNKVRLSKGARSPQKDEQEIRRNLKLAFSPLGGKKETPNGLKTHRETGGQKRMAASPPSENEKKKKGSPVGQKSAYAINSNNKTKPKNKESVREEPLTHRIPTTESVPEGKSPAKTARSFTEHINRTNNRKPDAYDDHEEQLKREEELHYYISQVDARLFDIPKIKEDLLIERRQREDNLENIKEEIRNFAEKVIEVVHDQAESAIVRLEEEFNKEMLGTKEVLSSLENCRNKFLYMRKYVERNSMSMIQKVRPEHISLKSECVDTLASFEEAVKAAQKAIKEPVKIIPTERSSMFKKSLKTALNEIFAGISPEKPVGNQPLPDLKDLGDFEKFLKSDEREDVLKIKPVKEKITPNIVISFENKDIFENALQISSNDTARTTEDSRALNLPANVFRTDSGDYSTMIFSETVKTPRLFCENEWGCEDVENAELYRNKGSFEDFFDNYSDEDQMLGGSKGNFDESKLTRFVNLLDRVNQNQNNRNDYLKGGKKNEQNEYETFMNFIENKLKDEGVREASCQKSLFQSPQFKEI